MDMSPFHATDDRMLSHIGGGLSRRSKRRTKEEKRKDRDEKEEKKRRRERRLVTLPKHEQLGTKFRGKMIPSVHARFTNQHNQHKQNIHNKLLRAPEHQRLSILDSAIPSPDHGALIAQHKISEIDTNRRGSRSWDVAGRVQDNVVSGPMGDRSVVAANQPLPFGPARGRRRPAAFSRKKPKMERSDILAPQMDSAPPPSHMSGDDYKKLLQDIVPDYDGDEMMPPLESELPGEVSTVPPQIHSDRQLSAQDDEKMEPQIPEHIGPQEIIPEERDEIDLTGDDPQMPEPPAAGIIQPRPPPQMDSGPPPAGPPQAGSPPGPPKKEQGGDPDFQSDPAKTAPEQKHWSDEPRKAQYSPVRLDPVQADPDAGHKRSLPDDLSRDDDVPLHLFRQEDLGDDVLPQQPAGVMDVDPPGGAGVMDVDPPGPSQLQGVHVYPTGGTIPAQQTGTTTVAGNTALSNLAATNNAAANAAAFANIMALQGWGPQGGPQAPGVPPAAVVPPGMPSLSGTAALPSGMPSLTSGTAALSLNPTVPQLNPPGPGQYQGVHVYPTGGTIPTVQPGVASAAGNAAMLAYQNSQLNQGTAAAVANMTGLYGAGYANYWGSGGAGSSGNVVPGVPGQGIPPVVPPVPGGTAPLPFNMPWLQNDQGQLLTRPGAARASAPAAAVIPPVQNNSNNPTGNLLLNILGDQNLAKQDRKDKKDKKKWGKKPDKKPTIITYSDKGGEDPDPDPPTPPISIISEEEKKDDPDPPTPPISIRSEEDPDPDPTPPPTPPYPDTSIRTPTILTGKPLPTEISKMSLATTSLSGLPSLPPPPPASSQRDKDFYWQKLGRLGFNVPPKRRRRRRPIIQQAAPAPVIIQGHQGNTAAGASSGGAGGSGAGGASAGTSGGSGGMRQATDPRTHQLLQATLSALQKQKHAGAKKRLNRQTQKQKTVAKRKYLSVRKEKLKAIAARQKQDLKKVTAHLKTVPRKDRVKMGKRLRAAVRDRYKKIKEKMPTATGKSVSELSSLEKNAKILRV